MPSTTEILLRIYQICGACWEWSVPIRRHLLYRDLNAKYSNNFLCVRTTFSLCGMEARKQGSNLVDGNWKERENERMKKWRNEVVLMEKMHPVPAGLIYGNREKGSKVTFFWMRILTVELSEKMEVSEIMKIFEDAIAIAEWRYLRNCARIRAHNLLSYGV